MKLKFRFLPVTFPNKQLPHALRISVKLNRPCALKLNSPAHDLVELDHKLKMADFLVVLLTLATAQLTCDGIWHEIWFGDSSDGVQLNCVEKFLNPVVKHRKIQETLDGRDEKDDKYWFHIYFRSKSVDFINATEMKESERKLWSDKVSRTLKSKADFAFRYQTTAVIVPRRDERKRDFRWNWFTWNIILLEEMGPGGPLLPFSANNVTRPYSTQPRNLSPEIHQVLVLLALGISDTLQPCCRQEAV